MSLSEQIAELVRRMTAAAESEDITAMELMEDAGQLLYENADEIIAALKHSGN